MRRSMRSWKVLTAMYGAPCGPSSKKMCNWSSSFEICMQHRSMASARTRNPSISSGISTASAKRFADLSFVSCAPGRLPRQANFMSVAEAQYCEDSTSRSDFSFGPTWFKSEHRNTVARRPVAGALHTRRVVCLLNALDHFEGFRFNRTAGL